MNAPSETPDAAETAKFLRRFADLMSNGYNAKYLQRAAELLETLSECTVAAAEEEKLWRYKYETAVRRADELEAECEALKQDIDGHLDLTTSILGERDALRAELGHREAELSALDAVLGRERLESGSKLGEREEALALLSAAFDAERTSLQAALEARGEELTQLNCELERERESGLAKSKANELELYELRLAFERERFEYEAKLNEREQDFALLRATFDAERAPLEAALEARSEELTQLARELEQERGGSAAKSKAKEDELSGLRLAFAREREELQAQLKVRTDELAALRVVSHRELDALKGKVAALEAARAESQISFDRVGDPQMRNITYQGGLNKEPALQSVAPPLAPRPVQHDSGFAEADAVVPKAVLRQVLAQFEYLAKDCVDRGDIASRVMCELGANAMDRALTGGAEDYFPVGEIALNILGPHEPGAPANAATI